MEESVSGFKVQGDWGEVVEHGERITRALREAGVEGKEFDDWDHWRPKSHELLGTDMREKTADHASISEGKGERAGETAKDDLRTAESKLAESFEKLESDETKQAVEKWQDSIGYVARAADSAGRKAVRSVEDTVYRRVMTQVSPYYFDNGVVSANVYRARGSSEPFVFEANVNDDELKAEVRDRLREYDEEVTRWHVQAEMNTEAVAAAEGVDPPEDNDGDPDGKAP